MMVTIDLLPKSSSTLPDCFRNISGSVPGNTLKKRPLSLSAGGPFFVATADSRL